VWKATKIAVRVTIFTLIMTGLAYPLVITGLSRVMFSDQTDGSLVRNEQGEIVGSALIGQPFSDPAYFHPRPSAAGSGYDAMSSGGSNFSLTSSKLRDRISKEVSSLKAQNPQAVGPIPMDLVTASASGLDPHISPEAALWQIPRIAEARKIGHERIRAVVEECIEGRTLGFLGEPRVNVLLLNLALDRRFGNPKVRQPHGG
jgi:potassium-transporting ATPase KdpC subunit